MDSEVVLLTGGVGARIFKTVLVALTSLGCIVGGIAVLVWTSEWKWGLGLLVFGTVGLAVSSPPVLRAGRYQLTTRRLVWRPYFGLATREVRLTAIPAGDIDVDADTAAISLPSAGLCMGSLEKFEELWGALLLWRELATLEHREGAPLDASSVMWAGEWVIPSVGTVQSYVVLRPDYLAVVPTRFIVRRSTGAQAAQLVAQLGLALVGVGLVRTSGLVPTQATLKYASHASADYFDALVHRMTSVLGGVMLPREGAGVDVQSGPRGMTVVTELGEHGRVRATVDNQLGGFILHVTRPAGLRGPT